tara:strand:+ start:93 stop:200 length:108 start_codon:yes stop_codon:yes gene_type:complete
MFADQPHGAIRASVGDQVFAEKSNLLRCSSGLEFL